jgi:hypothetical protein
MSRWHTAECDAEAAKSKAAVVAFYEKWPKAHKGCKAVGGFYSTYDPSPAGVALSPGRMTDYDPCEECEEKCFRAARKRSRTARNSGRTKVRPALHAAGVRGTQTMQRPMIGTSVLDAWGLKTDADDHEIRSRRDRRCSPRSSLK